MALQNSTNIVYISLNKTLYWLANKLELQEPYCYRSSTCHASTRYKLTERPFGFIALMDILPNKTKCFRGLKPLCYHERR